MTFLKNGGQLWALEDYCTQVGIATGHSAAIADFNWTPAHISVSILVFPQNFIIGVVFLSWGHFMVIMTVFCLSFFLLGNEMDVMPMFDRGDVLGSSSSLLRVLFEAYCCGFGASKCTR